MNRISKEARERIAKILPDVLLQALESYQNFLSSGVGEQKKGDNSKNFKSHHDACKMALSHIELLIKIAKELKACTDTIDDERHQELQYAIDNASVEILQYKNQLKDEVSV